MRDALPVGSPVGDAAALRVRVRLVWYATDPFASWPMRINPVYTLRAVS